MFPGQKKVKPLTGEDRRLELELVFDESEHELVVEWIRCAFAIRTLKFKKIKDSMVSEPLDPT